MNFLLKEDYRVQIGSALAVAKQQYPVDSIINVNNDNVKQCLDIIETRPILSPNWLVIIEPKLDIVNIKEIMSTDNFCILVTRDSEKYEELRYKLLEENIQVTCVDNIEIPKETILQYVLDSLPISPTDAEFLCKRGGYYPKRIQEYVDVLIPFDTIKREDIKRYCNKTSNLFLSSVTSAVLGLSDDMEVRKALLVIEEFKNAPSFILKTLKSDLLVYMKVFDYIGSGKLTLKNYKDFEPDTDDMKILKGISQFRLKYIITQYNILSYDKLVLIYLKVCTIKPRRDCMYLLINLIWR